MSLFDTTSLLLQRAMSGASLRQSVLADNMANANTPGYARRDVDFEGALRDAIATGADPSSVQFSQTVDQNAVMRADGNSVDVDTESSEIAKNELDFETLVSVSNARMDILRSAMGVNG